MASKAEKLPRCPHTHEYACKHQDAWNRCHKRLHDSHAHKRERYPCPYYARVPLKPDKPTCPQFERTRTKRKYPRRTSQLELEVTK